MTQGPVDNLLVFVDVETTGLDPEHERMTEIAFVKSDGQQVLSEEATLLNPECRIPVMISGLTGITNDMVDCAPKFFEKAKWILANLESKIVVGHNVRFDHGFISAEFRRLGYSLRIDTACTLRLAKHYIPEKLASYSLGPLCRHFGIPLNGAHRALADARASAELFHKLYTLSGAPDLKSFLNFSGSSLRLPPRLPAEQIKTLPKDTGVYYFYAENGSLIYVGKALNIRERVLSHFSADLRDAKERKLKEQVAKIEWKITGSELIALLHESAEIKKLKPLFNRAQRREKNLIGLYFYPRSQAYSEFRLHALNHSTEGSLAPPTLIRSFSSMKAARSFLDSFVQAHSLCAHFVSGSSLESIGHRKSAGRACFAHQIDRCLGACLGLESPEHYEMRLRKALKSLNSLGVNPMSDSLDTPENCEVQELRDVLLVEPGRNANEQGVVLIRDGVYRGFGFFNGKIVAPLAREDRERLLANIKAQNDNSDIQGILRRYVLAKTAQSTSQADFSMIALFQNQSELQHDALGPLFAL